MTFVAFLGDSLTETAPGRADIPWPHEIEYERAHVSANYGVGGSTVAQMDTRYTSQIQGEGYGALVLMGGIVNINAGDLAPAIWTTLEGIVDQAITDGLTVYLCTTLPAGNYAPWDAADQTQLDALLVSIRGKAGVTLLETHNLIDDGSGNIQASMDSGDGLHLNQVGSTALADFVGPLIV